MRFRTRLIRLAIFLLIGACTTLAIAWSVALASPLGLSRIKDTRPPGFAADMRLVGWLGSRGFGVRRQMWVTTESTALLFLQKSTAGLPWPALASYRTGLTGLSNPSDPSAMRPVSMVTLSAAQKGIEIPNRPLRPERLTVLPLIPLWPGFILDTALFALAAWFPLAAVRTLRRIRCRRLGRCPRCAYDVQDLAVCPECGSMVSTTGTGQGV